MFFPLAILFVLSVVCGAERCCFPTQMEGKTTLVTNLKVYFYRNARFAVDFIEGRFIILHPNHDERFLLYNYADGEYFERFEDGSCLRRPVSDEEVLMDCIPDDYVLAGDEFKYSNDFHRQTVDIWTHGNKTDVDYSYIIVKKADENNVCIPEGIQQNLHHETHQRTDHFYSITIGLRNNSILFPDVSDCTETNLG